MTASFLGLPIEIREMIYKYCLCYDGVLTPYPTRFNRDEAFHLQSKKKPSIAIVSKAEKPTMGLLAVNRQIHTESKDYFTRHNVWRWKFRHSDYWTGPYADKVPAYSKWLVHQHYRPRHVLLAWDSRDLDINDSMIITSDISMAFAQNEGIAQHPAEDQARRVLSHKRRWETLRDIWAAQIYMLSHDPGIRSVVIDAKNAKCPSSCCRKFKDVLVRTIAGKFDSLSPPSPSSNSTASFITSPLSRADKMSAASSRELVAHNIKIINLTAEETIWAHQCGFGCDACQFDKDRKNLVPCATFASHRRIGLEEGLPKVEREVRVWSKELGVDLETRLDEAMRVIEALVTARCKETKSSDQRRRAGREEPNRQVRRR